jgi:predicted DNA-binding ribbon-helix-helix protein
MQSAIIKRSIVIAGHKTSVSLEDAFWHSLKEIGRTRDISLSGLIGDIDIRRRHCNLSSSIRLFVLEHFRSRVPDAHAIHAGTDPTMLQIAPEGRALHQGNGRTGE